MIKKALLGTLAAAFMASTAHAAEVKVGFVTTLTTPAAVIGKDMQNAVNLAVEHMGSLLYTSPSPRDLSTSRMPSSA